jgi:hypothetical protein
MGGDGSGFVTLIGDLGWKRDEQRKLLRLLAAHDRKRISARAVADHFAKLNDSVHQLDGSVGPRCVVVWKHRGGGGAFQCYAGTERDGGSFSIPAIANGFDMKPIMEKLRDFSRSMPREALAEVKAGTEIARLPNNPDKKLR